MREEDDCGIEAVSSTRKGGNRRWHARLGRWIGSCLPPSCLNKEEDRDLCKLALMLLEFSWKS
jgi:hypothetical protein